MFNAIYQSLQERFNQSRLSFLSREEALAQLITQPHPPSPWNFFNTYFALPRESLDRFRSQIVNLAEFDVLTQSMSVLNDTGIYDELNCNAVAIHADPYSLARALSSLAQAELLTDENRLIVAVKEEPLVLVERTLEILRRYGILNPMNFAVVATRAHPDALAHALFYLQRAGILTEENRDKVAAHADSISLAAALASLQRVDILTPENRDRVAVHANPYSLANALSSLQRAGILTGENRYKVAAHADPYSLAKALSSLQRAGILTQGNFDALLAPNHAVLVSEQAYQLIWGRMPIHLLTQVNFARLLRAAEQAEPMAALQRVRDQILGIELAEEPAAAAFNPAQSTHTASVHRSVSASATKLMHHYGRDLNFEAAIQAIKEDVGRLEDSPKHQAAKRCIERITTTDYTFTDTSSRVSTCQLLALAYTAIHDEAKREGSLEDAKAMFVEGLYEIQRGYNLDASGADNGKEDGTICSAGTFNKILEKLNGIHSDVELYYITREGASSKFPKLAQEHALAYLKAHLDAKDTPDLVTRIKEAGSLEPIWENIKAEVEKALWDEFKDAYGGDRSNRDFLALIDNGQYVQAPDLSAIEVLLAPKGALDASASGALEHKEDETQTPLERHGLWASPRGAGESTEPDASPKSQSPR